MEVMPMEIMRDGGGSSMTEELTKLSDLKAKGLLTDEEFENAKKRVIQGV